MPTSLLNAERVADLPLLLAIGAAVLAAVTFAHALLVSARRSRRELAICRALGFTHGQVRTTLSTQAVALAATAAVLGVPLGVIGARLGWRVLADAFRRRHPAPRTPVRRARLHRRHLRAGDAHRAPLGRRGRSEADRGGAALGVTPPAGWGGPTLGGGSGTLAATTRQDGGSGSWGAAALGGGWSVARERLRRRRVATVVLIALAGPPPPCRRRSGRPAGTSTAYERFVDAAQPSDIGLVVCPPGLDLETDAGPGPCFEHTVTNELDVIRADPQVRGAARFAYRTLDLGPNRDRRTCGRSPSDHLARRSGTRAHPGR